MSCTNPSYPDRKTGSAWPAQRHWSRPCDHKGNLRASRITMSLTGGIANTQEIVDLCARHDIRPEIEIVPAHELNQCTLPLTVQMKVEFAMCWILKIRPTIVQLLAALPHHQHCSRLASGSLSMSVLSRRLLGCCVVARFANLQTGLLKLIYSIFLIFSARLLKINIRYQFHLVVVLRITKPLDSALTESTACIALQSASH